jgi:tetratricopeptide (TPR) repeat protein
MTKKAGLLLLVIAITAAAASTAVADERTSAREHYLNGKKAFELGQFEEAISEYAAAYRLKDDPALLYNLGQAHRLAGHAAEALHFYKVYLNRLPNAPNRDEVVTKIAELEKLVEQQKKAANLEPNHATPLTPSGPIEGQKAPGTQPEAQAPAQAPAAPPPPPQPSWSERHPGGVMKVAGIVVGAVGVALLGTGIGYGVKAKNAGDALTNLNKNMGTFDPGLQSDGKNFQVIEGVTLGIGAAALAAGAALVVVGQLKAHKARAAETPPAETPSASIVPLLGPRVAGASVHLRF